MNHDIWQIVLFAGLVVIAIDAFILFLGLRLYAKRKKRQEKSWMTAEFGSELHIIPQWDIVPHRMTDHCSCAPRRIPGRVLDNPNVFWTVQHKAADGRENSR